MIPNQPFRYLHPHLLSGLLDDPLLLIGQKKKGQNLLFDCGQIDHIAKKSLKSVGALFITHAHMDHFIGFDRFVRANLVTGKKMRVFGPEGIAFKIEMRLKGYDWNLTEDFFVSLEITEILPNLTRVFFVDGSKGFSTQLMSEEAVGMNPILQTQDFTVYATVCDHHISSLAFKVIETTPFTIDADKIDLLGLKSGKWILRFKDAFERNCQDLSQLFPAKDTVLSLNHKGIGSVTDLFLAVKKEGRPAGIGYVTDIGGTTDNITLLASFFDQITMLFCECAFLSRHKDKARKSKHLCVDDFTRLIELIHPRYVIPIHLSKTYLGDTKELYEEIGLLEDCELIEISDHFTPMPIAINSNGG